MPTDEEKARYWQEKQARRKTGYPCGTVAYYGPDASRASKVVVGVVTREGEGGCTEMKKVYADDRDLREDRELNAEILAWLASHDVVRIAKADRIIGCPHEEGIDYPEGETCPQCPYWANRDRFTGELLK